MEALDVFCFFFIYVLARRGGLLRKLLVIFGACWLLFHASTSQAQALPAPDGISALTIGPLTWSTTAPTGVRLSGPQALAVALYNPTAAAGCDSVRLRVILTGPASVASRSAVRAPLDTPATVALAPVAVGAAGRYECLVVAVFYPRGSPVGQASARTFYLDLPGQPLPVTLTSFTISGNASTVRLAWTSAAELNLDHYEAQVSATGETWATVGRARATGAGSYELLLAAPTGLSYYRLRSVDTDGSSAYSPARPWAGAGGAAALVSVGGQRLTFTVRAGETPDLLTVYDYTGRRRWTGTAAGADVLRLPVGAYIVVLSTAQGGRYVTRLAQL